MQGWEHILDKFGWPTLGLIALAVIGRTIVWPIIKKKLDQGDRAAEQVTELLIKQTEKAESRIERADRTQEGLLREFKDAIEHGIRESKRQGDLLEELLRRIPRQ